GERRWLPGTLVATQRVRVHLRYFIFEIHSFFLAAVSLRSPRLARKRLDELGGDRRNRQHVIDFDMTDGAERHAWIGGVLRILHDGDAAAALDGQQSGCAVVERSGEDNADGVRTVREGGAAEQRIDRRAMAVLARAARRAQCAVG